MHLSADSVLACTTKTAQRLLAEFPFSADWPPYSQDFNLLDFSISCVLQAKVQAMPHSNLAALFPSNAAECDWLATVYICITCRSFHCHHEAATKKNEV
jgi:hypothetical protein